MKISAELDRLLRDGCHRGCDYDEAEGGLFNHCDKCCRRIATLVYQELIIGTPRSESRSEKQA